MSWMIDIVAIILVPISRSNEASSVKAEADRSSIRTAKISDKKTQPYPTSVIGARRAAKRFLCPWNLLRARLSAPVCC
jgi:hypothetical protein